MGKLPVILNEHIKNVAVGRWRPGGESERPDGDEWPAEIDNHGYVTV